MPLDPNLPADVYICYGVERETKFPHWMLMIRSRDSAYGTWYHSTGGPTQNIPYQVTVQDHKRAASPGIGSLQLLGTISPKDQNKVKAAAQRVPPQQCQRYVVALISELEHRGLLPPGRAAQLSQTVQMSQVALDYANMNPVPQPTFLSGTVQPTHSAAGPSLIVAGQGSNPSPPSRSRSRPSSNPSSYPQQAQSRSPSRRQEKRGGSCCIAM